MKKMIDYQLKLDDSKKDLLWLIWYTGWSVETARTALRQWKAKHNYDTN